MRRAALLMLALGAAPAFADPPGSGPGRAWVGRDDGRISAPAEPDAAAAGDRITLPVTPARSVTILVDGKPVLQLTAGSGSAYTLTIDRGTPTPDGPTNPADDPDETFVRDLLAAYEAAPDADAVIGLSTVYRASAADVAAGKASTAGELLTLMKAKAEALGLADAVPAVQQVVSVRLTRLLGADPSDAPNAALPADTAKVLNEIADVLRELTNE